MYLWDRYFTKYDALGLVTDKVICGFSPPPDSVLFEHYGWRFRSMGRFEDYPAHRWSDAWIKVLEDVAESRFLLMLEDYWLCRPVDVEAIHMLYDYCNQFQNVLKIDLTMERLFNNGGGMYQFGFNTYNHVGYLDLVKSPAGSQYQMSLWGGLWNRDVMRRFIVSGERAQQIELNGTTRVNQVGDEVLVLGTRQAPILHGNIYQSGRGGKPVYADGGWAIPEADLAELRARGWIE